MIDGIDEIDSDLRIVIEKDLAKMAKVVSKGQIIATCRSGDYLRQIEGFDVFELQPLSKEEIRAIVGLWCTDPDGFFKQIENKPYEDLLNRPLYLCQIVLVFNEWRRLPERPVQIYRRVVLLMLEKWDRERGIERATRYSTFSPEEKEMFLSHIAHDLLRVYSRRIFEDDDLRAVYSSICDNFGLLKNEAPKVAEEIESHTGFIVMSSTMQYEFSHLSIQEYLAASYLVRQPSIVKVAEFLRKYPASPAIAVCLSSETSDYFARLIFAYRDLGFWESGKDQIVSFLQRLKIEHPRFVNSAALGAAVLLLVGWCGASATIAESHFSEAVSDLFVHENVAESVKVALHFYAIDRKDQQLTLSLRDAVKRQAAEFEPLIQMNTKFSRMIGTG